jgi:hypothetical protein
MATAPPKAIPDKADEIYAPFVVHSCMNPLAPPAVIGPPRPGIHQEGFQSNMSTAPLFQMFCRLTSSTPHLPST